MPATFEPIVSTTLTSASTSVSLTSIPATFTDLHIVVAAPGGATGGDWAIQFNGDTASNYSRTYIFGTGSGAGSGRNSSQTYISLGGPRTSGIVRLNIQNYSNTTTNKTTLHYIGSAGDDVAAIVGLWRSTAAITSVRFFGPTWPNGSTFSLYGIRAGA